MVFGIGWRDTHQPYLALRTPVKKMIRQGDLPDLKSLQSEVSAVSASVVSWAMREDARRRTGHKEAHRPEMADFLAQISSDITRLQPVRTGRAMTLEELGERAAVYRLIRASEAEAPKVIALFKGQEAARNLWERGAAAREEAERYDAQKTAYAKAIAEWESTGNIARYHDDNDLVGFLQDMKKPDPDLWYVIACEAECGWKADDDALLWILGQLRCDRATIATFLARYAKAGWMSSVVASEHKRGESRFADEMTQIIERWNAGFYKNWSFHFLPEEGEGAVAALFQQERTKATDILGREAWGTPVDVFCKMSGHTPAPTLYFRHGEGLMTLPPRRQDYLYY